MGRENARALGVQLATTFFGRLGIPSLTMIYRLGLATSFQNGGKLTDFQAFQSMPYDCQFLHGQPSQNCQVHDVCFSGQKKNIPACLLGLVVSLAVEKLHSSGPQKSVVFWWRNVKNRKIRKGNQKIFNTMVFSRKSEIRKYML